MKKFPKEVYVQRIDGDTEDEYLNACEDLGMIDEGEVVAVYVLKETKKLRVLRELV
jgi:hypothetical protein